MQMLNFKYFLPQKELIHLVKSDFAVIAQKVIPNVAAAVATAESNTLAGSYIPQILDTMQDQAIVNAPRISKFVG